MTNLILITNNFNSKKFSLCKADLIDKTQSQRYLFISVRKKKEENELNFSHSHSDLKITKYWYLHWENKLFFFCYTVQTTTCLFTNLFLNFNSLKYIYWESSRHLMKQPYLFNFLIKYIEYWLNFSFLFSVNTLVIQ